MGREFVVCSKLLSNKEVGDDEDCKNNRSYSVGGHKCEIDSSQIIRFDNGVLVN
jgi:hypothetical protein